MRLTAFFTQHGAVAVGDRLPLHRQLRLHARLRPGAEDGDAHALLHAGSEHRGRRHQVTPEGGGEKTLTRMSRRGRERKEEEEEIEADGDGVGRGGSGSGLTGMSTGGKLPVGQ